MVADAGSKLAFVAVGASFLWFYLYRYWKYFRYLRWKLRVIPIFEKIERHRKGLCTQCSYDLRGSPNRCPECGTVPPKNT